MPSRRDRKRNVPGRTDLHPFLRSFTLSSSDFTTLGVPASLNAVLAEHNIVIPTPIQAATLPDSLAGRDVLGRGRTGSGKTYAFLLPMLTRLAAGKKRSRPGKPRGLIVVPTRELATQIEAAMAPLGKAVGLRSRTIFGGVGQNPQVEALRRGVDVVIACPGRLEDLIAQGHCQLGDVEVTVLDEADHMADLGFLPAVRRILAATPSSGQRLLFSATLDAAIDGLVKRFLHQPVTHQADSPQTVSGTMTHRVLRVTDASRLDVLADLTAAPGRTVVFTRTKSRAKRLAKQLNGAGIGAMELHGNLSQNARVRAMEAFHGGQVSTLVATDIAARGIHVDDISLVIHADPPVEHKAYLHRSGRTARAGSDGTVVTLMTDDQRSDVTKLLRLAGISATISRVDDAILREIAPGERVRTGPILAAVAEPTRGPRGGGSPSGRGRAGSGRSGTGRSGSGRSGSGRSGSGRSGSGREQSSRNGSPSRGGAGGRGRSSGGAAALSSGFRGRGR